MQAKKSVFREAQSKKKNLEKYKDLSTGSDDGGGIKG